MAGRSAPAQALEIAETFSQHGVRYLFIGKSAAILMGYPAATQDVLLFIPKDRANATRVIAALEQIGFRIGDAQRQAILACRDFIQLGDGPFDLDLISGPDGIETFAEAEQRAVLIEGFPLTSIDDIIASKRAAGRERDLADLPLLEAFRTELRKNPPPLLKRPGR